MSVIVRSSSAFCSAKGLIRSPVAIRCCSSLEEIKAGLEHVKRHRKVVQGTVLPKTLTAGLGSGKELNIAANMSEVAALSGMPDAHQKRTVVIQPRQLKTLQSGDAQAYQWQIVWKHSQRWTNPLMGWSSTADPMAQVKLSFDSKDDAIAYAQKNGWKYETRGRTAHANENNIAGDKIYAHNFLARRTELELAACRKAGKKTTEYEQKNPNASNWFMMPNYDGTADVIQHGNAAPPSKR